MTIVFTSLLYFLPWLLTIVIHLAGSKETVTLSQSKRKTVALDTQGIRVESNTGLSLLTVPLC